MRAAFAVVALLAIAPASAQQIYHLEVDANDIAYVGAALNELPKKIADPLIAKLQGQINAQNEAAKKAAETAKPKAEPKPEADKVP